MSPVKDSEAIKKNIEQLIEDDDSRKQIVINGVYTAKDFSFMNALNRLEEIIKEC